MQSPVFGQQLRRELEETKSCRTGGICTSVRPSVCPPVSPSPPGPSEADPGPSEADPGLSEADPGLLEAGPELGGPALRSLGPPLRGLGQGGMDEWMDGRTDSPCSTGLRLLQFPPELLPKKEERKKGRKEGRNKTKRKKKGKNS